MFMLFTARIRSPTFRRLQRSAGLDSTILPMDGPFLLAVDMMTKPKPSLPLRNSVIVYGYDDADVVDEIDADDGLFIEVC